MGCTRNHLPKLAILFHPPVALKTSTWMRNRTVSATPVSSPNLEAQRIENCLGNWPPRRFPIFGHCGSWGNACMFATSTPTWHSLKLFQAGSLNMFKQTSVLHAPLHGRMYMSFCHARLATATLHLVFQNSSRSSSWPCDPTSGRPELAETLKRLRAGKTWT